MWRGTTRWQPFLSGANMVRAGWLATGKMVIYPIRDAVDAEGRQLVNWVAEIETPHHRRRDWNRPGNLDDFLPAFADWHFDWLDVPAFLAAADMVLEFPMVDQDPLPRWSHGRVTLLGDAAHPMVPRGSNGAGQAILDAAALAECLAAADDPAAALKAYEDRRREATAQDRAREPDEAAGRDPRARSSAAPATARSATSTTSSAATSSRRCRRATSASPATTGRGSMPRRAAPASASNRLRS